MPIILKNYSWPKSKFCDFEIDGINHILKQNNSLFNLWFFIYPCLTSLMTTKFKTC